jgi:hypothetical protein
MLRILSINPTGFGPYGVHQDVPLDNCGVVWLSGVNGSGKSCLFNVISYCLWGRVETVIGDSVAGTDEVSNETLGASCPRVVFMAPTGTYRVTCSRKWKAKIPSPYPEDSDLWPFKGTDIYLERLDESTGVWCDYRESTSPKTRDRLRSILGVSYERYLVTTYLAQGKGLDFLRGKHSDRMSIFTDVANLGLWDNTALMCKVKRGEAHLAESNASAVLARLQGELNGISIFSEESATAYSSELATLQSGLEAKRTEKKQYDEEVVSLAQQMGAIQTGANPYIAQLRDHNSKAYFAHQQSVAKVQDCELKLRQHDESVAAALERAKAKTSTDVYTAKSNLGVAEVAERKAKQAVEDFLSGKLTHCPTCGQELPNKVDGAHLQADLDNCVIERKSREALLKEAQDALDAKRSADMREVQEKGVQDRTGLELALSEAKLALDRETAAFSAQRVELECARDAYDKSEASKSKAVEDLNVKQQSALNSAALLQRRLDADLRRITELETALRNNEAAKVRQVELTTQVAEAEKTYLSAKLDTAEWSWLTQNLGLQGVQAWGHLRKAKRAVGGSVGRHRRKLSHVGQAVSDSPGVQES